MSAPASTTTPATAATKVKVNRDTTNLRPYIRKVLSQASGQNKMKLSRPCLDSLNIIAKSKIEQLTKGAISVANSFKVMTISGREVSTAAETALAGEIGANAVNRGRQALEAYTKTLPAKVAKEEAKPADAKKKASPKKKAAAKPAAPAGKKGRKSQSRNIRAGLKISISRVENNMRPLTSKAGKKLGRNGAIVMAGIIEYLLEALFSAAAEVTRSAGRVKIMQKSMPKALESSTHLFCILADVYHQSLTAPVAVTDKAAVKKGAKKAKAGKAGKPAKAGKAVKGKKPAAKKAVPAPATA